MASISNLKTENEPTLLGHPVGLFVLFFTELWERFSYYGMRGLLVLFLVDNVENGGFGMTDSEAIKLYGWYTMLVYVMSIPGGILADKVFGQKKAVMIGGALLVIGHGVMAIPGEVPFYSALGLIILGVGLLKPNISTMVGGLYKKGDSRRDKGFTIFYMGINTGSLLAAFICGYVGEVYGWHYGFGLAGIGMVLGQVCFIYGQKYLKGIGELVKEKADQASKLNISLSGFLSDAPALVSSSVVLALAALVYVNYNSIAEAVLIAVLAPAVGMGVYVYGNDLNRIEKDRVIVLLVSFVVVIIFWASFEQAGGLLNIYTKNKVNLSTGWDFFPQIPASWFQGANAFFIITLGVGIAAFWSKRGEKGKESSSLFKMAVGNIIMGLGFLFMVGAALQVVEENGVVVLKAGSYWLIGAYLLHTVGELCLSPVSLSFITKLAPARYASIMMGLYFAMTGFGNKLAATVGEAAADLGELNTFVMITCVAVGFGVLLIVVLKPLKRLTHGAEEDVMTKLQEKENRVLEEA